MSSVKYVVEKGLQQNYNNIQQKEDNVVYFCTDTGNMYLGARPLFDGSAFIDASFDGSALVVTMHGNDGSTLTKTVSLSHTHDGRYVRYDTSTQDLTDAQKSNARTNIGAGTSNLTLGTTNSTAAYGDHKHGNIQTGGTLQSSDVTIASGDKLVITDTSDSAKIARASLSFGTATTTFLANNGTWQTPSGSGVKYNDVLMPTNPFGGRKLYINSLDNAFAAADKKYWVKITTHKKEVDGVTYPYVDTTKAVSDDNYWVDSPVVSTLTGAALFNGNYEDGCVCPANHYMKIHIQFAPFSDTWTPSGTTSYWTGYPYGQWYLSYYYTNLPGSVSQCRVYNKYAQHTAGWHVYNATAFIGSITVSGYIEQISDESDYQRTCVEFIIYGKSSGNTTLTQIDYKLSRPNLSDTGSTVTKFGPQSLFYNFTWYKHNENATKTQTVQISANDGNITTLGYIDASSFKGKAYYTGSAIDNGDTLIIGDATYGQKLAQSTLQFDGSTTTQALTKKGTWGTFLTSLPNNVAYTDTSISGSVSGSTSTSSGTVSGTVSSPSVNITFKDVTDALGYIPPEGGSMVFKGTQKTASSSTIFSTYTGIDIGHTWKIIQDPDHSGYTYLKIKTGASTTENALVGDTIICTDKTNGYWVRIPSGDEPSGTVTSVATGTGLTGGPITTSGTISHADIETTTAVSTAKVLKLTTDGIGHIKTTTAASATDLPHTHSIDASLSENNETVSGRVQYVKSVSFTSGSASTSGHTHAFTQPTIDLGSNTSSSGGTKYVESVTVGTNNAASGTHTHTVTVGLNGNASSGITYVDSITTGTTSTSGHTHTFTQPTINLGSNDTSTDGVEYLQGYSVSATTSSDNGVASASVSNGILTFSMGTFATGVTGTPTTKYFHPSASNGSVASSTDTISGVVTSKTNKNLAISTTGTSITSGEPSAKVSVATGGTEKYFHPVATDGSIASNADSIPNVVTDASVTTKYMGVDVSIGGVVNQA